MFSIHNFVKNGFLKAVGRQPDYWILLNSAGWLDKGVLTESDLEEIQAAVSEKEQTESPDREEPWSGDSMEDS